MIDIQQCNLESEFTAANAAALILGVDQEKAADNEKELYEKLLACMRECHESAVSYFIDCLEEMTTLNPPPRILVSTGLQFRVKLLWTESADFWLENEEKYIGFENQKFTRNELDRWLSAIGLASSYPFVPSKTSTTEVVEKTKNAFTTKERKTLLLIIFGIVKVFYEYSSNSQANKITCKVKRDLEDCGVNIQEEFIREYLKESYELDKNIKKSNGLYKVTFDESFLTTAELNTLLSMLIGLAIACYKHDPTKSKNSTSREIQEDLQKINITVSDDTIRNYLKKASELDNEIL